jgi:hypothetical protein
MPEELCHALLSLMNMGLIAAHVYSPVYCLTPGERPVASLLARRQAAAQHRVLTNLCHCPVEPEDNIQKALVTLLDGTRTRTDLVSELALQDRPAALDDALRALGKLCLLVS